MKHYSGKSPDFVYGTIWGGFCSDLVRFEVRQPFVRDRKSAENNGWLYYRPQNTDGKNRKSDCQDTENTL